MPIKIPDELPARRALEKRNIFVITENRAIHQDIRPLEVALLNLMPKKVETETQIATMLSNTPLQVNLTLLTTETYIPTHTNEEHLGTFYKTWSEVHDRQFDGLIVTGAPVENLDWEDVAYWEELKGILDWSEENVWASMFICWGAQAALHQFHGLEKYQLPEKRFGVFKHVVTKQHTMLLRGFDDDFWVPVSRHTEIRREDVERVPSLEILSESDESGLFIVQEKNERRLYVFNHAEYDRETLKNEYDRDRAKGLDIAVPKHYFQDDDDQSRPVRRWYAHAHLLFSNWLNYYVYQTVPYELDKIRGLTRS